MNLSEDQTQAIRTLKSKANVFITGEAGSGKSFVIREYMKSMNPKKNPVLASTGSAAVLVGGRTFHSFFALGIMEGGREAVVRRALDDRRLRKRLKDCEGFIVDEVSMLSGATLSAAEEICRMVRESTEAWGGLRVIAVGDFAQLPPIEKFSQQKPWAFLDPVWQSTNFQSVVLKQNMRSGDQNFLRVLNEIRSGKITPGVQDFLNSKTGSAAEDFEGTRLFPRRNQTDEFNSWELNKLEEDAVVFRTTYFGNERAIEQLKKNSPLQDELVLKVNALVMLRQNDPKQRFVNGSTGHVRKIEKDSLTIELLNGRHVELEPFSFSLLNAEGVAAATATNFPVSLAYAATIHKSQGMTIDRLVVDLKSLWEPGHAYVALSRITNPDCLRVTSWSSSSIKSDPDVRTFYENLA